MTRPSFDDPKSWLALLAIVAVLLIVMGFEIFATTVSNDALAGVQHARVVSDRYDRYEGKLSDANAAFYRSAAYPGPAAYNELARAIEAAIAESASLAEFDPEGAGEFTETLEPYAPVVDMLKQAATDGTDVKGFVAFVPEGWSDSFALIAREKAREKARIADEKAVAFSDWQDLRLGATVATGFLELALVVLLVGALRRFGRRDMELRLMGRAHEQMRAAKDLAEGANRAKSEFLSRMSHELRTPMNAVLGFAQILQLEDLTEEQQEDVSYIMSSGRHLLRLIDEVLDISRIEAGRLSLSLELFDPADVIDEVMEMARPLAAEAGIALNAEPAAVPLRVVGDVQRTKQALLNLVSNGIKYNREGGSVCISVTAGTGQRAQIRVRDTGPGIAKEKLGRLFQPFDRLDADATGVEGTGLGLALSRRLIEAMNGVLTVESEPGLGSVFAIELPSTEEAVEDVSAGLREGEVTPLLTVVYIEDNLSSFGVVERALRRRGGVRLLAAKRGAEGIALSRESAPDFIFLDYHLPDMTGIEVLSLLKQDPATTAVPVVILTADISESTRTRALAGGAVAVLRKPYSLADLFAAMRTVRSRHVEVAA